MKGIVLVVALLACALKAQAQGVIQFNATLTGANEFPPNNDPTVTTGTFSLSGNSLSFTVNVPLVTFIAQNAYIQGPASPGSNGPIIFDLGGPVFHSGSSQGDPPYAAFFSPYTPPFGAGPFTLSDAQINDLLSGLWYVNVTSSSFPDGQLRGQILEVPEPSTWALFGLGSLGFWFWRKIRNQIKFALAICVFAVLHSASAQPGCTFCPPNHSSYTLTVQPGWSLVSVPLFHFRGSTELSAVFDNSLGELFKTVPTGTVIVFSPQVHLEIRVSCLDVLADSGPFFSYGFHRVFWG